MAYASVQCGLKALPHVQPLPLLVWGVPAMYVQQDLIGILHDTEAHSCHLPYRTVRADSLIFFTDTLVDLSGGTAVRTMSWANLLTLPVLGGAT